MPILHYILPIQLYIFSGSDVSADSGFDSKLYIHSIMYNTYYTNACKHKLTHTMLHTKKASRGVNMAYVFGPCLYWY